MLGLMTIGYAASEFSQISIIMKFNLVPYFHEEDFSVRGMEDSFEIILQLVKEDEDEEDEENFDWFGNQYIGA